MTASEKVYNYGFNEGRNEGKLFTLFDLIKDGFLSIEIAAKKANMTVQDFSNQMKLAGYTLWLPVKKAYNYRFNENIEWDKPYNLLERQNFAYAWCKISGNFL